MNMLNDHDSATVSLAGVMPLPLQKGWPAAALLSRSCRTSMAFINGDVANHIAIELRDHRGENRFVTGVASAECGNSGATNSRVRPSSVRTGACPAVECMERRFHRRSSLSTDKSDCGARSAFCQQYALSGAAACGDSGRCRA